MGIAAPCQYLLASEGCVFLMSEMGVAPLCGCVSCGLWVPLMCWVCGRELPWALQVVFTGQEKGCVCLMSVAAPCRCLLASEGVCMSSKQSGVAALCGCVSCGLWVPLMWSVCGVGYCGRCGPLPVFTGQVEVSEGCVLNERSGCGTSLWVCLLWSVGASDVLGVWA